MFLNSRTISLETLAFLKKLYNFLFKNNFVVCEKDVITYSALFFVYDFFVYKVFSVDMKKHDFFLVFYVKCFLILAHFRTKVINCAFVRYNIFLSMKCFWYEQIFLRFGKNRTNFSHFLL